MLQAMSPLGAGPAEAARSGGRMGGSSFSSARSSGCAGELTLARPLTTCNRLLAAGAMLCVTCQYRDMQLVFFSLAFRGGKHLVLSR